MNKRKIVHYLDQAPSSKVQKQNVCALCSTHKIKDKCINAKCSTMKSSVIEFADRVFSHVTVTMRNNKCSYYSIAMCTNSKIENRHLFFIDEEFLQERFDNNKDAHCPFCDDTADSALTIICATCQMPCSIHSHECKPKIEYGFMYCVEHGIAELIANQIVRI